MKLPDPCHPNFTPWLYMALPLILLSLFWLLPTLMAFGISFLSYSHSLVSPHWVGLANYAFLLQSHEFWQSVGNTLLFALGVVPAMVILPIGLAVVLNAKIKGIALFRGAIYLPVVVPAVVTAIVWRWLYAPEGLLNTALSALHLPSVAWLTSAEWALTAVALMVIWKGLGYYMMMYLASLQSVSAELYEAAMLDGASVWQRHWHITLPHLRPMMGLVATISTIGAFKLFTEVYVMTRGGPIGATQTWVYYIYNQAFGQLNLGIACAAGLVLMGFILVFSAFNMRYGYMKSHATF